MTEGGLTVGVINPEAVVIADEDDGGVVIDFAPVMEEQIPFDANLAEHMDEGDLSGLASDLLSSYDEDRASRSDWEEAYMTVLTYWCQD